MQSYSDLYLGYKNIAAKNRCCNVVTLPSSSGNGILTINNIQPDNAKNFTLEALNGIQLTSITNGIDIKNIEGTAKFVVDGSGNCGYTTIQSAINAALATGPTATNQQTIWIWLEHIMKI